MTSIQTGQRRRVTPSALLALPASASRDEWLAARRHGIGSSDIAAVMGVSPYRTASHVYHDKRGDLPIDDDAGEAALWGNLLEETVAREWARRNRSVVRRVGLVSHETDPWRLCTLDRRVTECPMDRTRREACALEVKTRNAWVASRWLRVVPDDVLAQVLWQIAVTGYDHVHVACLIGGQDYRQYVIRRAGNEDIVADILTVAGRLWADIRAGRPPTPTGDPDALVDLYDRLNPDRDGVAHLDAVGLDVVADLDEYETARLEAKAALGRQAAARARLVAHLDAAEYGVLDGQLAYTYTAGTQSRVDLERLAEDWPDAYADCLNRTTTNTLRIKKPYRRKETTA